MESSPTVEPNANRTISYVNLQYDFDKKKNVYDDVHSLGHTNDRKSEIKWKLRYKQIEKFLRCLANNEFFVSSVCVFGIGPQCLLFMQMKCDFSLVDLFRRPIATPIVVARLVDDNSVLTRK